MKNFQENRIYLDHNATTPPAAFLNEKLPLWLEAWGNPSSIHWHGRGPKSLLRDSRKTVARFLNCDPLEVIFTSGGSESNNLAIKGVYESLRGTGRSRYLLSAVEHPSVTKPMQWLREQGAEVIVIPVNRQGEIDLDFYSAHLNEHTALVSVMFANNETGHMFPIPKMAKLARKVGAFFHCDGVQSLGRALVDVNSWQVDLATFSGHKFYSLRGCGVLYARKGLNLVHQILGGGQERGRRAGTENTLAIASFAEVLEQLGPQITPQLERINELRNLLETQILTQISGVKVTGQAGQRLVNTSSLVIDGVDGETLLMNLDLKGCSVSTGAACSSGSPEPSPALLAMGLTRAEAQSSLRLSLGWGNTPEEIERFVGILVAVVERLRRFRHGQNAMLEV